MNRFYLFAFAFLILIGYAAAQRLPALEKGTAEAYRQEQASKRFAQEDNAQQEKTQRRLQSLSYRTWRHIEDGREFNAAIVGYQIGSVILEHRTGKQFTIPIEGMSLGDRRHISVWLKQQSVVVAKSLPANSRRATNR